MVRDQRTVISRGQARVAVEHRRPRRARTPLAAENSLPQADAAPQLPVSVCSLGHAARLRSVLGREGPNDDAPVFVEASLCAASPSTCQRRRLISRSIWGAVRMVPALAVMAGALAAGAQAAPRLYFAAEGSAGLRQVNLDGTDERVIAGALPAIMLTDLKVDNARVYWTDAFDRIASISLDSRQVNERLIDLRSINADEGTTRARSSALAVHSGYIYFAWSPLPGAGNSAAVAIGRARSDGSDVQLNFISPTSLSPDIGRGGGITSLTVDDAHIYWADARTNHIGRARIDGSDIQQDFIATTSTADAQDGLRDIAVSPQHLYWTHGTSVGRANIDGTDSQPAFRQSFGNSQGIAISREHLYWSRGGSWERMNLDGSDRFSCFYTCTNFGAVPNHIAISPEPAPKPSRQCSIAKRSVLKGETVVASCRGLSGRVTVTVAETFDSKAAAPAGSLGTQLRFSRTVRKGRLAIPTNRFCRSQYNTERFRILFTRDGYRNAGAATIRVRSKTIAKRCRP